MTLSHLAGTFLREQAFLRVRSASLTTMPFVWIALQCRLPMAEIGMGISSPLFA